LIPLEIANVEAIRRHVGRGREVRTDAGDVLRVTSVGLDVSADGRSLCHRLRYERIPAQGETEVVERDWRTRCWPQSQFREMLLAAGFETATFVTPEGARAAADASVFVALARRGPEHG
jgi:hypothetical protein